MSLSSVSIHAENEVGGIFFEPILYGAVELLESDKSGPIDRFE
jgi:hypothetical protein